MLQMIHVIKATFSELQATGPANHDRRDPNEAAFLLPFVGHAVLSATDILSIGSLIKSCATTILLIENILTVFERLNRFWAGRRDYRAKSYDNAQTG